MRFFLQTGPHNAGASNWGIEAGGRYSRPNADHVSISPTYFKRTVGEVASAQLNFGQTVNLPRPKRGAAKLGLRFEKQVLDQLSLRFTDRLATGVPISFQEFPLNGQYSRPSTAIPDAFLLSADRKSLCVIEIKLRHSTDAWFQLGRFYLPLMRKILGGSHILKSLEICRYYDPGVKLPARKEVILNMEDVFSLKSGSHPVYLWERA